MVRWTGEQVDVYANEIRWLAGMAELEGKAVETTVKLAFVTRFHDSISTGL